MIGIFIGIAAVVALISLSQGLKIAVEEQFVSLGSDKIIIQAAGGGFGPPGTGVTAPLTDKEKKIIQKTPGVELAVGRLIRIVNFEFNDQSKFTYATTVPDDPEERELILEANNYILEQGRIPQDGNNVMIGATFAAEFFDKPLFLRDKIKIQGEQFKVVGILEKSGNPQKDNTAVISEDKLRDLLDLGDVIDIIPAKIAASESVETVSERVKKELRKSRGVKIGKEDFTVQTPGQLLDTLNTILIIIQGVLVGVACISLVVGGIGIMNTMYTAVVERTKEVGVLKALGATNKQILLLFLLESGMLGLIGGLIGIALGLSLAKLTEYVAFQIYGSFLIKASFEPALLIGALLFAFCVGALSGALPAKQAAKLHPVEALRK